MCPPFIFSLGLLSYCDVQLSAPSPALCLPTHCQSSHHNSNGLNL
ncbi:hypothetical protein LEMLEM_LOCUS16611 [Lemmus lemmus]